MSPSSTSLDLPDTKLVSEARAVAEAALDGRLLAHSLRAFSLGRAYAHVRAIDFDEEGLCLAALFHDLGLVPGRRDPRQPFTASSSRQLGDFLRQQDAAARAPALQDAIDYHMQLLPRWPRGPVAGLLQIGAWMDVTGLRRWTIRKDARAIEAQWPRAGFGQLQFMRQLVGTFTSVAACTGLMIVAARG